MKKKILCIDDSLSIRHIIKLTLEREGYDVDLASDGLEALECVKNNEYNLCVADYHMPNMDGISFIKEVRKSFSNETLPIIMLTTECITGRIEEGKHAGADGWIIKPFNPSLLTRIIDRLTYSKKEVIMG